LRHSCPRSWPGVKIRPALRNRGGRGRLVLAARARALRPAHGNGLRRRGLRGRRLRRVHRGQGRRGGPRLARLARRGRPAPRSNDRLALALFRGGWRSDRTPGRNRRPRRFQGAGRGPMTSARSDAAEPTCRSLRCAGSLRPGQTGRALFSRRVNSLGLLSKLPAPKRAELLLGRGRRRFGVSEQRRPAPLLRQARPRGRRILRGGARGGSGALPGRARLLPASPAQTGHSRGSRSARSLRGLPDTQRGMRHGSI